jgi:hypothetical protein
MLDYTWSKGVIRSRLAGRLRENQKDVQSAPGPVASVMLSDQVFRRLCLHPEGCREHLRDSGVALRVSRLLMLVVSSAVCSRVFSRRSQCPLAADRVFWEETLD